MFYTSPAQQSTVARIKKSDPDDPDCLLILDKQRNGEAEGRCRLFFDPATMQYLEHRHDRASHSKAEVGIGVEEVTTEAGPLIALQVGQVLPARRWWGNRELS